MSDTTNAPRARRLDGPIFAIAAALSVVGLARLLPDEAPAPPAALAGTVSSVGDSTAITLSSGNNEDVLALLDQRSGAVLVYRSTPRRTLELLQATTINELFEQARSAGPSNRR